MRVDPSLVRSEQWWNHKVPPLIAVASLLLVTATKSSAAHISLTIAVFLAATIGIAAFGHVVNDLSDITADALAGKPNKMSPLGTGARSMLVFGTLALGLLPWLWLPSNGTVLMLVAIEVVLLVVYSVPPIRLKDRGFAGVAADALYAYLVPVLLTLAVFTQVDGAVHASLAVVSLVGSWAFLMGIRGIIWHQIGDIGHDRRSGISTLATRIGANRGRRLLGGLVLVEFVVAGLALVVIGVSPEYRWLPFFGLGYLIYRTFQVSMLWSEPIRGTVLLNAGGRVRFLGFVVLNEFVEKWLPVAALVALSIDNSLMWVVTAIYVVAFDNAFMEFVGRDLPALPDAINRLAHERRSKKNIKLVESQRLAAIAAGPAPVDEATRLRNRWVFVVCGPEMHLDTLATAVKHLRPMTSLEIWVVTDSSRNVHPIEIPGVDRVVDVTTPAHLDDHQASIWLKTSIHKHLPPGEWCYLDSDIIAVRPGIEAIFKHRHGPVAFASDLTIAANQVDRFSPWAMTCECSGNGDEHSCGHLREQIRDRLGIDVPGDWLHWNGGVFLFGEDSAEFLSLWHNTAVESFDWPEWRTRDQGALIATAWLLGQQDCPRIPSEFNFIADLGNGDLCLTPDRGWALHPSGPWHAAKLLHLYTSRLEDPSWEIGKDLEAPIVRRTLVRVNRWRSFEVRNSAKGHIAKTWQAFWQLVRKGFWASRTRVQLYINRLKHLRVRLTPSRIRAAVGRRLGRDSHFEPSGSELGADQGSEAKMGEDFHGAPNGAQRSQAKVSGR